MPWEKVKMGEETMNQIQIPIKEKIQTNMNMNKYKKNTLTESHGGWGEQDKYKKIQIKGLINCKCPLRESQDGWIKIKYKCR